MRAVIIDDLPLAIASLKDDLETHCPDIEILDTADSVVNGAKLLMQSSVDLVFLDIHMTDGDGFDVLDIVKEKGFSVIFTTASPDHAIKAFQYDAVDYLLKPVDPELLVKAVEKVKKSRQPIPAPMPATDKETITLNSQEELRVVAIHDIIRLESMDNYCRFILKDGGKFLVSKTLKIYEEILSPKGFLRSHQSHMVNLKHVKSYVKSEGGYIMMDNGDHVPVSVRKKPEVMKILS